MAAILALVVIFGPARARPWQCRTQSTGSSARTAAGGYYASCWTHRPRRIIGLGARPGADQAENLAGYVLVEDFKVTYPGSKTRFLVVAQRHRGGKWRTHGAEGSAP